MNGQQRIQSIGARQVAPSAMQGTAPNVAAQQAANITAGAPTGAQTVTIAQSPAVSYQINQGQIATPNSAALTPAMAALNPAMLSSLGLSPPHQPVTPQAQLASPNPQQQALNLATMMSPAGPVPLGVPGTPSQGAVLSVNNSLNTPNQATMPLNGQKNQFFGYQGQNMSPQVTDLQPQTTPIQQQVCKCLMLTWPGMLCLAGKC